MAVGGRANKHAHERQRCSSFGPASACRTMPAAGRPYCLYISTGWYYHSLPLRAPFPRSQSLDWFLSPFFRFGPLPGTTCVSRLSSPLAPLQTTYHDRARRRSPLSLLPMWELLLVVVMANVLTAEITVVGVAFAAAAAAVAVASEYLQCACSFGFVTR